MDTGIIIRSTHIHENRFHLSCWSHTSVQLHPKRRARVENKAESITRDSQGES